MSWRALLAVWSAMLFPLVAHSSRGVSWSFISVWAFTLKTSWMLLAHWKNWLTIVFQRSASGFLATCGSSPARSLRSILKTSALSVQIRHGCLLRTAIFRLAITAVISPRRLVCFHPPTLPLATGQNSSPVHSTTPHVANRSRGSVGIVQLPSVKRSL